MAALKEDIDQLRSDLDDLANTFNIAMQDIGGGSQSDVVTPRVLDAAQGKIRFYLRAATCDTP